MSCRTLLRFVSVVALSLAGTRVSCAEGEGAPIPPPPAGPAMEDRLAAEFGAKNLKFGAALFIRVYKQASELQLWVQQGPRYVMFKTYPVCRWSGGLGPKMQAGDRQSPEGLYTITGGDLIENERWHRAMNINYPNAFDTVNGRTGSGILIHGRCRSIGCFSLQDANVEEVYASVRAALKNGQQRVPVLVLPFRFSGAASGSAIAPQFSQFWQDLRRADFLFNRDRLPPAGWLCDGRYAFADRRGDRRGHALHLPGCKPLNEPLSSGEAAALRQKLPPASLAQLRMPGLMQLREPATRSELERLVMNYARSCDPKNENCKMIRTTLQNATSCPMNLARCRTAHFIYMKSIGCPVKYPRCRFFVGPELGPGAHAAPVKSHPRKASFKPARLEPWGKGARFRPDQLRSA